MKRIFTTTLRLDLTDDEDRRAWAYLKQMDKKQHRSYSKVIAMAVNEYFERLERLESDPYLETREKEDAFLQRIQETIAGALRYAPVAYATPVQVMDKRPTESKPDADDDLSTALDFADSF